MFNSRGTVSSADSLLRCEVGGFHPHERAAWLADLLNPIVRAVFETPNPDSIRFRTICSPKENAQAQTISA
jgi:hypothetical protein